jgi:hypothetical protein
MPISPGKDGGCLRRCLLSWLPTPKICNKAADCWPLPTDTPTSNSRSLVWSPRPLF